MKIRQRVLPSGSVTWQLDVGTVAGKRQRLQFETKELAEAELKARKGRWKSHGSAALALTGSEMVRFAAARDRLAELGATIEQAVEVYEKQRGMLREPATLAQLLERCLEDKTRLKKRMRYILRLRSVGLDFIAGREEMMAHAVTQDDIAQWLNRPEWEATTQVSNIAQLRAILNWGVKKGMLTADPCKGMELPEVESDEVARLPMMRVRWLIWRAAEPGRKRRPDYRSMLGFVVLGLFCGIRPEELAKMTWSEIDLKHGQALVSGKVAKSRQRRVVDISPNAVDWLRLCPDRKGPIVPRNFAKLWRGLRAAARQGNWVQDTMRHTFASMHYARHQNEALLQVQMGHESAQMLFQVYRGVVRPEEAARFWALRPRLGPPRQFTD